MNWLKSIFTSSENPKAYPIQKDKIISADNYIDLEFIKVLYFKDSQLRNNYINSIRKIIEDTIVDDEISRVKVSEYLTYNENNIPFLMEAIKLDEFNGKIKINKYYTALGISRYNIRKKIDNDHFDFTFEETLALNAFKSEYRNYVRLETLFLLGRAFLIANNISKMNFYFDIIYKDKYELSEVAVSKFHRLIGDIYMDNDKKTEAFKWYKSGLQLNSKLGVKKIFITLEKELNSSKRKLT